MLIGSLKKDNGPSQDYCAILSDKQPFCIDIHLLRDSPQSLYLQLKHASMKKLTALLPFIFLATLSFAQKDSTYFGKWKIIVETGESRTVQSYMLLKQDSTFITSRDSTFSDANQKASEGKWKVTAQGEVKLIPSDTSREIHYYRSEEHT